MIKPGLENSKWSQKECTKFNKGKSKYKNGGLEDRNTILPRTCQKKNYHRNEGEGAVGEW